MPESLVGYERYLPGEGFGSGVSNDLRSSPAQTEAFEVRKGPDLLLNSASPQDGVAYAGA
jgi:hypothetical protein